MKTDATFQTRITHMRGMNFSAPKASPDGKYILAVGESEKENGANGLYIMDIDGENPACIVPGKAVKGCAGWLDGGRGIIFALEEKGRTNLYISDRKGKNKRPLTSGKWNDINPSVSPDGKQMVFESDKNEKNISLPYTAGNESESEEYDPDTAVPDGKKIEYNNDGMSKIYIMGVDGKRRKRLTNGEGQYFRPFWSADGKKIYFFRGERGSNMSVWKMDVDGKNQEQYFVMEGASADCSAAWVDGGGTLLISMIDSIDSNPARKQLYRVDQKPGEDGGYNLSFTQVTTSVKSENFDPCLIPGGHDFAGSILKRGDEAGGLIATASNRDNDYDIYVMEPDGRRQRRLTSSGNALEPCISHDRKKIAYVDYGYDSGDKINQIFTANIDGTEIKQLSMGATYRTDPKWSPDGGRILFLAADSTKKNDLFVMNADGSGIKQLTNDDYYKNAPSWSPDGKKIVFSSTKDEYSRIFTMDADGRNISQVTKDTKLSDENPCWSPDGGRILFIRFIRDYRLMTVKPDGTGEQEIESGKCDGRYAAWSPDGKRVAFIPVTLVTCGGLYVMDGDGRNAVEISDSDAENFGVSWR
jgi:Tol biopolymer transport system component